MKNKILYFFIPWMLATLACSFSRGGQPASPSPQPAAPLTSIISTETFPPIPTLTETLVLIPSETPSPTETPTSTPILVVESMKAKVAAGKLSCRYGPGAEYLFLYALNEGANIKLVGRTDANNWVWVDGTTKCWVNTKFLNIQGDPKSLPIVYPGLKLPVSQYYPGPSWAKATREGNTVKITWEAVPISPGKYEDEFMHQYIVEVWRCKNGQIIFETLGTNFPFISVANDEKGCNTPSHGRVYVQEKHGYGGPVEVPWPPHTGQ